MILRYVRRAIVGMAVLITGLQPAAVEAQRFAIDAEVVGASASLAFGEEGRRWGLAAGLTVPELRVTLTPAGGDFGELLHLAAFLRRAAGPAEVDVGMRLSVAGLWDCTASDCWPGGFLGAYAAGFVGGRLVEIGARVQAGKFLSVGAQPDPAFVIGLVPFMVRMVLGR